MFSAKVFEYKEPSPSSQTMPLPMQNTASANQNSTSTISPIPTAPKPASAQPIILSTSPKLITPTLSQAVIPVPKPSTLNPQIDTTTTFTTNINPSVLSQSVTLTAQVNPNKTGYGTPTGSVHFFWKFTTGDYDIATVNLDNSGKASYNWSPTYGALTYVLEADYSGSNIYSASSSYINQTVITISTKTVLTSSLNPSTDQSVIFTAQVIPDKPGYGSPTGSVHLFWRYTTGNYDIATVNLDSLGKATWKPTYGAITYILEADYSGSSTYAVSSNSINQQVK